jgi:hypothetical protein
MRQENEKNKTKQNRTATATATTKNSSSRLIREEKCKDKVIVLHNDNR